MMTATNSNALRLDLDEAIKERHSTRMFLPKPVPRDLLDEALTLAQLAPSNSNIEPWHVVFVSGPPRDRLVAALLDEAKRRPPTGAALPEQFQHFRTELGSQIYGAMGMPERTKSVVRQQSYATGSSFGRRWQGSSACIEILASLMLSVWGCSSKHFSWL